MADDTTGMILFKSLSFMWELFHSTLSFTLPHKEQQYVLTSGKEEGHKND
jgi:hypothetical protein